MSSCEAERREEGFCGMNAAWVIKAANYRMLSCRIHLNQMCDKMLGTGVEYMTVSKVRNVE